MVMERLSIDYINFKHLEKGRNIYFLLNRAKGMKKLGDLPSLEVMS